MTTTALTRADVLILLYAGLAVIAAFCVYTTAEWLFWRLVDHYTAAEQERDHAACEGEDCDQTICCCPPGDQECVGTTTQGCPHHQLLCWDCRLHCPDCRTDARDEADAEAERHRIGVRR
jgi:hypothetical protein